MRCKHCVNFVQFQLVWIETPTNPLLKLTDIQAAVEIAKSFNQDIKVAVDNTFSSPYFQVRVPPGSMGVGGTWGGGAHQSITPVDRHPGSC